MAVKNLTIKKSYIIIFLPLNGGKKYLNGGENLGLAQNIKFFRERNGLSQSKLSELLGCSLDTVGRWENEIREPRANEISKLAEIFKCTTDELFNGPEEDNWRIVIKLKKKGEPIEMSQNENVSISVSETGLAVTLSADPALWADEEKFSALLEHLKGQREAALKMHRDNWG